MKTKKEKEILDSSTEEKIKEAAKLVFHQKGFAATRTRDIADAAGINLALLNYYFRSKQNLFDIIILESLQEFFKSVKVVLNNSTSSFEEKIEQFAANYIDFLIENPDVPLFLISELRNNPKKIFSKLDLKDTVMNSSFMEQFQKAMIEGEIAAIHPFHFIINLMGMTVFPFIANAILRSLGDMSEEDFNELMLERKALIPVWIKAILKPS